ncbi:hypothetical protein K435DRAFT_34363 [Dendrothele bispora CBS 962.96]|uniref:Uncharacterized protein n=1 Tax=Dendrothele bispora (strain CBS 962.96) TaxID=1314807 RepID=A0A4S8KT75_DENBC|nr:hypothetical protein K435DRAFT_34363 [Dendrothele bispora CBS 962.96]
MLEKMLRLTPPLLSENSNSKFIPFRFYQTLCQNWPTSNKSMSCRMHAVSCLCFKSFKLPIHIFVGSPSESPTVKSIYPPSR